MRGFRIGLIVCVGLLFASCSTMTPATYANYADNTVALRQYGGAQIHLTDVADQSNLDKGCRLAGPIEASGGRTVAQFIRDSFNDELKFAAVYGDGPSSVAITGAMTEANFSSTSGLVNGWWSLTLKLTNPQTGYSYAVSSRYDFKSGFDAATACKQTAEALTPAVQKLINKAVTDPGFRALVGK